jgi:hypothetical protein
VVPKPTFENYENQQGDCMCSIVNGLRRLTKGFFYGAIRLADNQSSAIHVPVQLFWFSVFTFYPETDLVK